MVQDSSLEKVKPAEVRHSLRNVTSEDKQAVTDVTMVPISVWEVVFALALAGIAIAINWDWICADKAPLFEHSGRFIRNSVVTWMRFNDGESLKPDAYPPLAYIVSCFCYSLFGLSRQAAMGSQLVFYIPYVLACWWLGRRIGGRGGGLLVAAASAGNLWFALHLHGYFLEIALTAMVACAWALLVASDGCRNKWPCIALGVCLGLGMLTKWAFIIFVGPAFLWPLVVAWREGAASRWLALVGLVAVGITLAVIYVAWGQEFWAFPREYYFYSMNGWLVALAIAIWAVLRRKQWNAGIGLTVTICIGGILSSWWYFLSIQELQVKAAGDFAQQNSSQVAMYVLNQTLVTCYWLVPLFFVGGLVYGFARPGLRLISAMALSGIAPAFVFYACSNVPIGARYMLPSTVFVMVIAFAWLGRWGVVWKCLLPVLVAVSVLQLWGYKLPRSFMVDVITHTLRIEQSSGYQISVVPPPDPEMAPIDGLTKYMIDQLNETGEARFTAAIMPDARLDVDMLMLESLLQGRFIDI